MSWTRMKEVARRIGGGGGLGVEAEVTMARSCGTMLERYDCGG